MLKWWKTNRKLAKYRKNNPKKNIDAYGNIIIDECHMVCFVNDDFPTEHQMMGTIDATSKWFSSYGSTSTSIKWHNRKSNPIVFKVANQYELHRVAEQMSPHSDKVAVSYFAGELISLCIGPIWSSRIDAFDMFEHISYE